MTEKVSNNNIQEWTHFAKTLGRNKNFKLVIGILILGFLPISNYLKVEQQRVGQLTNSVKQETIPIAPVDESVTPVAVDELTAARSRADFETRKLKESQAQLFTNVNSQLKTILTDRALKYQALAAQKATELGISPELAMQTLTNQQIERLQNVISDPNTSLEQFNWVLTELQAIRFAQEGSLPERGLDKLPNVTEFSDTAQPPSVLTDLKLVQEQVSYYLATQQEVRDQILRQAEVAANGNQTQNNQQ